MKTVNFKGFKCEIKFLSYPTNDRPRIVLTDIDDGMQVANCTLNVPCRVNEKHVIIKDYSENEGIYKALLDARVIKPHYGKVEVGFAHGLICELNICRVCDDSIHIPRVCSKCSTKIIADNEK